MRSCGLMLAVAAVHILLCFGAAPTYADAAYCRDLDGTRVAMGTEETYFEQDPTAPKDTRAEEVEPGHWAIRLRAYLYVPTTPGAKPTIVYNHGHEAPLPPCALVNAFVKRGFIVFAPFRPGYGPSTGQGVDQYAARGCEERPGGCTPDEEDELAMKYFRLMAFDIVTAVDWLKRTQTEVDPDRMVLLGHAEGGGATLFANLLPLLDHKAAIDISGGALSWDGNRWLRNLFTEAAGHGRQPVFFLQAKNDQSLEPTRVLSRTAWKAGRPYLAGVYPAVPDPADPTKELGDAKEVDRRFVHDGCQVAKWIGDVLDFLARTGVSANPPQPSNLPPDSPQLDDGQPYKDCPTSPAS